MDRIPFSRLLIANRGEIAIRIARAATELGIRTISIYSYEDRFALHRYKTDESYCLGEVGKPLSAYLDPEKIVTKAKELAIDAIHPGYGFLSENEHFASLCEKEGIKFIGPSPSVLAMFGDKTKARSVAKKAGLTPIPGSESSLASVADAKVFARSLGYPVTLKAVAGGGGKGIRMLSNESELEAAFERAKSEALTSFGRSDVYLEKTIVSPKHIEVQILGGPKGEIVHLFERDCSIQRRHQKVIEIAPALGTSEQVRGEIRRQSLALAKSAQYEGLGTVEFLVDKKEIIYFLEVNPRIQVEHTVTEMITGIDLVQASILVAAGVPLKHPLIGIASQESIRMNGAAIQCRITTEDPRKDFAPDTGRIIAYRPAAGFGIRFDEGHGTSGGLVTPYYDSLLVKVTSWGRNLQEAASKMHRSLSEFRIRGIKHNISLLKNVMRHPDFLSGAYDTDFLEIHKEVYQYPTPKDRATRLLRFLAELTVNDPHKLGDKLRGPERDAPSVSLEQEDLQAFAREASSETAKSVFDKKGAEGLVNWIKAQKPRLLLTDTTMRDAHQSLFATRLRTHDILRIAPFYDKFAHHFFSLEVWGGATFDTALRFLREDPWERLVKIREKIPNILLQMLLRGDNAVGYTNYPEWVIRDFIKEACRSGLDIFRIFDCFNQPDKMEIAIDEVRKHGAIAEVCLCYSGDLSDPRKTKYTLKYYLDLAKTLEQMGAHILCIKDMAGLLRPQAAVSLVKALSQQSDIPIHLHTHDTSGAQVATLLQAREAGCHIVDGAVSSMAGLTSQPSLNALIASLERSPQSPGLPLPVVDELARYWGRVRSMYQAFDPGIKATSTDVYVHEIPGGQYSNFYEQAKKVGLSAEEFFDLTLRYKEVNDLLGDIIKVTPSSKVVGDMALLLQKKGLKGPDILSKRPQLDYPDSLLSFMKGHLGTPTGGFPEDFRKLVLGEDAPSPEKEPLDEGDSIETVRERLHKKLHRNPTTAEILSSRLYPKVFDEYLVQSEKYGRVTELPTPVFFYGMNQKEEIAIELEPGKTLYISLEGKSDLDENGRRSVFFKLNGFNRVIELMDESVQAKVSKRPKAEVGNDRQIAAAMPGKILEVRVKEGDKVNSGDVLLVTESMKMEYTLTAKSAGFVASLNVKAGDLVESEDLLITLDA
ncbi:MAG: pyruvate carboxylase [Deltaproteobacteria bacterium]|nr:pyruvate carboxylase [Deltaproteobacteria bacterium]